VSSVQKGVQQYSTLGPVAILKGCRRKGWTYVSIIMNASSLQPRGESQLLPLEWLSLKCAMAPPGDFLLLERKFQVSHR
jgi:hypothetical protein